MKTEHCDRIPEGYYKYENHIFVALDDVDEILDAKFSCNLHYSDGKQVFIIGK